jgi:hypothetical protein
MRSKKSLFPILLFLFGFSLFITSCHENESLVQKPEKVPEERINVQEKALSLINKQRSQASLRDGDDTLSITESDDVINHALNMNYCRPSEYELAWYNTDTIDLDTPVLTNDAGLDQLLEIATHSASDFYYSNEADTVELLLIDAELYGSSKIVNRLIVHTVLGVNPLNDSGLYPYDDEDNWYFNLDEGYCNGLQDPLEDALDQWRKDINRNEVTDNVINGKIRYYYTYDRTVRMAYRSTDPFDPVEIPDDPLLLDPDVILAGTTIRNQNDNILGDYYLDYWTWWLDMGDPYQDRCVDDTEMNYHYGAIVQGFQNQLSSNEDLIRFENGWSQFTVAPAS